MHHQIFYHPIIPLF